jgi:hypothetical protein
MVAAVVELVPVGAAENLRQRITCAGRFKLLLGKLNAELREREGEAG